jgi:hypothetical protein
MKKGASTMRRWPRSIWGLVLLALVAAAASWLGAAAAAPEPDAQTGPALEEFVPSEELPADSAISFPVDI